MLESISKDKNEQKYLYLIHMKDKTNIKLGRANDADVRMTDISVSRSHANLYLINGSFYIDDLSSKFGTLVQINDKISIMPYKPLSLQVGRGFLLFNVKKNFLSLLTCYT